MKYNQMIFDCNEERKLANKFLATLLNHNRDCLDNYNDIHIYQEEDLIIIEWCQKHYNNEFFEDRGFKFVDCDQEVMTELILPDNSSEFVEPGKEDIALQEWLEENPGWYKDDNGRWREEVK